MCICSLIINICFCLFNFLSYLCKKFITTDVIYLREIFFYYYYSIVVLSLAVQIKISTCVCHEQGERGRHVRDNLPAPDDSFEMPELRSSSRRLVFRFSGKIIVAIAMTRGRNKLGIRGTANTCALVY